jgi:uncharacterized membrane protein (DUF106 family)
METELKQLIEAQQKKIDEIYESVEKTRKYLYWTMVATIVFFVLPLVAMIFIIPTIIGRYASMMGGLGI